MNTTTAVSNRKPLIVIEVNGGLVQEVYSNVPDDEVRVVLVDWDNIEAGDSEACDYPTLWLSKMDDATRAEVAKIDDLNLSDYE